MKIRPAELRDLLSIVEIGTKNFPYIEEPFEFFLKRINEAHVFVAVLNGEVVGFVDVDVEGNVGKIEGIAVKEEYRGLGIGKKLLSAALMFLAYLGVDRVQLMTMEDNLPARRLYESMGFEAKKKEGKILWYERELRADREV